VCMCVCVYVCMCVCVCVYVYCVVASLCLSVCLHLCMCIGGELVCRALGCGAAFLRSQQPRYGHDVHVCVYMRVYVCDVCDMCVCVCVFCRYFVASCVS